MPLAQANEHRTMGLLQDQVTEWYGVAVTSAEKQAIGRVLSSWSEVKLRSSAFNDRYNDRPRPAPQQRQQARPQPVRRQAPQRSYSNCSQAHAACVAPIYRGRPGYSPKLDLLMKTLYLRPWRQPGA